MHYEVIKELQIPDEAHFRPIDEELLEFYKLDPEKPEEFLPLVRVSIKTVPHAGSLCVGAFDGVERSRAIKESSYYDRDKASRTDDLSKAFGAIAIQGAKTPEQVIQTTEQWIKNSADSAWVPGPFKKGFSVGNIVSGDMLVRGGALFDPIPEGAERTRKWLSKTFIRETEEARTGTISPPEVPVGTPMGVSYVPSGRARKYTEYRNVGLSPVDQFATFLNRHGAAIKEWEIVDGTDNKERLVVLFGVDAIEPDTTPASPEQTQDQ